MIRFEHFLGSGFIWERDGTLRACFDGMWSDVEFEKSRSLDDRVHNFLTRMWPEQRIAKIELYLWIELEKVAKAYIEHKRNHGGAVAEPLLIETPESLTDGYSLEQKIVGKSHKGLQMYLSPTGYVGVRGRLSTVHIGGIAHVQNGMLSFDTISATRGNVPIEGEKLQAVVAKLNQIWTEWATGEPKVVAASVQARRRLLARADEAWPIASNRIIDAVRTGRNLIELTDCQLHHKLSALSLDVVRPSPEAIAYPPKASSLEDLAEVSVGVAEAIGSLSHDREDIADWRLRIGVSGRKHILIMAEEIMGVRALFPSIASERLDADFFVRMLDHFDFIFTEDDYPIFNARAAASFFEGYFGLTAMSSQRSDQGPQSQVSSTPRF